MKTLAAGFLGVAAGGLWSSAVPPARFQSDAVVTVAMVQNVRPFCGAAPQGLRIVGCTLTLKGGKKMIVMPNPCLLASSDWYARVQCHELGHVNSWSNTHEK